mmetsp:Transcript_10401/g.12820  ORF Transcript_10401/g.12820 Transcript_10401/m.12820 type:complete len:146 (+) Transcript_10401:28-465(+)|eukprot:CAMPEP_0172509702 /NCGR_PEP_ID=MMETSP1066-20121228/222267_1 /TAXON_ID=671091 /ORGANISM="Coscinodiscus wailesii, Strain CCMP2513" /LENGTH=145 /DNA_ID=CAMNT_0013288309 /DNA_START=23 /DNA_END=460 /DNA_ORIENTATION=+
MSTDETHTRPGRQVIDIYLPTYILKPAEDEKFYPSQVKQIAERVLQQELDGKIDEKWIEDWMEYGDDFENLTKDICQKIKDRVRTSLNLPRYKIVVQLTLGQMKDQGVCITSRCLWDTANDNYASVSYQNEFIWACALVFGMYTD